MKSAGGTTQNGGSRALNKLSDRTVRAFITQAKAGAAATKKLADGGGLFLMLTPSGSPVWRIKYRFGGKERVYAAGIYPDVTLERARAARADVKDHLRAGRDPVKARLVDRRAAAVATDTTFASMAGVWLAKQQREWSGIHYEKSSRALERDVLPTLGTLPIADISAAMVADVVEKIAERGAQETAARVLQHITGVFRLARSRGVIHENVAIDVREVLPRRRRQPGRPALLNPDDLRDVLRRADLAPISPAVRLANRLIAFSAQRIGNVVAARWDQLELETDAPTWTIPRAQMKVRDREFDHRVPLGPTIAAELRTWRTMTRRDGVVFPSPSGKREYVGREAIEKLYVDVLNLAGRHSPHAWRTSFSTLARDVGEIDGDIIELMLDHVTDSAVIRVYNRAERFAQRLRAAQWWDALLTSHTAAGNALPFRTRSAGL